MELAPRSCGIQSCDREIDVVSKSGLCEPCGQSVIGGIFVGVMLFGVIRFLAWVFL